MIGVEQPTGRLRTINFTASEIRGTDGFGERAVGVRAHMTSVMQSSEIHYPFLVSVVTPPAAAAAGGAGEALPVRSPGFVDVDMSVDQSWEEHLVIGEVNGRGVVAGREVTDCYLDDLVAGHGDASGNDSLRREDLGGRKIGFWRHDASCSTAMMRPTWRSRTAAFAMLRAGSGSR